MGDFFQSESFGIWIAIIVILIMFLIWNVVINVKLSRMKKTMQSILGDTGVQDLPKVMEHVHEFMAKLSEKQKDHASQLDQIQQMLARMKGNVGVHRYNAFSDTGSDLSFSIAMIDQSKDGVVISGIHNRDDMYVYAKPLIKGESNYSLTLEEKQAINLALPLK